jgi:hypothetical protein
MHNNLFDQSMFRFPPGVNHGDEFAGRPDRGLGYCGSCSPAGDTIPAKEASMSVAIGAALYCSFLAAAAWPQSGVPAGSEPSPMEAFAGRPGAHPVWSSEVGRMEHDSTHVLLTALVVEDGSQPARKARGVKIDLSSGDERDRIYLDEEAAARTRSALEDIASAVARSGAPGHNGCMGAKEFWPLYNWPWNKYHELNVDFCGESKDMALVLYGRGRRGSFRFPGENPARLAAILASAMGQLKQH